MIDSDSASLLRKRFRQLFPDSGHVDPTSIGTVVKLKPGQVIFREQDEVPVVPLILEGSIRVFKASPTGSEITLYEIGPGETCVLAASAVLGAQGYRATAVAETDGLAWLIPRERFIELFLANERLRAFVFDNLSTRLSVVMSLVEEISFKRMDSRLAGYLVKAGGSSREIRVTHEEIAADLGTAREVVSRILKDFERQGLVRTGRGRIVVSSPEELSALAENQ